MITSNPILSAKVLQVANSAYYGMAQKLNSISHAIMIIGMVNIKAIIYHEGVLQALNEQNFRNNPTMKTVWQHSNYTSIYASYLHYLFGDLNMGTLFTLGLLHDIGKFIMMKLPQITAGDGEPSKVYSSDWTLDRRRADLRNKSCPRRPIGSAELDAFPTDRKDYRPASCPSLAGCRHAGR